MKQNSLKNIANKVIDLEINALNKTVFSNLQCNQNRKKTNNFNIQIEFLPRKNIVLE